MKEKVWNRTGMRMINFESDHKTFNRYIVSVSRGNVIGGGQYSSFVRCESETKCNGHNFEKGHLRRFDLEHFNLSWGARNFFNHMPDLYVILYEFYHYKNGKKTIHGHIAQEVNSPDKFHLFQYPGTTYKSRSVLEEATSFLN